MKKLSEHDMGNTSLFSELAEDYLTAVASGRFLHNDNQVQLIEVITNLIDCKQSFFPWSLKKSFKGLYIHGGVGSGKSTIVKMCLSKSLKKVKKLHYNHFINKLHLLIKQFQDKRDKQLHCAINALIDDCAILYLDEMQVHDISNAMLLRQFFDYTISKGIILITTSNYAPSELYSQGFQRELFFPTINLIEQKMFVIELKAQDHRLIGKKPRGICFIGKERECRLFNVFTEISAHDSIKLQNNVRIKTSYGHNIKSVKAGNRIAIFRFKELCGNALWTQDYNILTKKLNKIFVIEIPKFSEENKDESKRFSMFIDELYNNRCILYCSALVPLNGLYEQTDNISLRTTSRLLGMCQMEKI